MEDDLLQTTTSTTSTTLSNSTTTSINILDEKEKLTDVEEYMSRMINLTPHDINIMINGKIYTIPFVKENIMRALAFYKQRDVGAPYITYSNPTYNLYTPTLHAVLDKNKDKITEKGRLILIVSKIVADAMVQYIEDRSEDLNMLYVNYPFQIQCPNTNPDQVVRDELGNILYVKSMIVYNL